MYLSDTDVCMCLFASRQWPDDIGRKDNRVATPVPVSANVYAIPRDHIAVGRLPQGGGECCATPGLDLTELVNQKYALALRLGRWFHNPS